MRQHIGNPDQSAASFTVRDDLHRGAVLLHALADGGIDQSPPRIVAVNQKLARHRAVGEGNDASLALEPGVEHEARHEAVMQGAEVTHRVPYLIRRRIDWNVLVNGSHDVDPCLSRTNRLDVVAVGVDQKRSIVGRAVIGARTGGAIVAAAGLHALGMELPDRGLIWCAERDMGAGVVWALVQMKPQSGLALGTKACAICVLRAQDKAKWRECRRIKTHGGVEVAYS